MNLSASQNRALATAALTFPAVVLGQCSAFYMLPFLIPFITGVIVALYGFVLSVLLLAQHWSNPVRDGKKIIGIVAITWIAWAFVPTQKFSMYARFWLEFPIYKRVVAQIAQGEQPGCFKTHECLVDAAPYVVFPFPGFLSGWIGVVYVPALGEAPERERLKAVAADAGCDSSAITPHYYFCSFY